MDGTRGNGRDGSSLARDFRSARVGFALLLALVGGVLLAGRTTNRALASGGLSFSYPDFSRVAGLRLNGSAARAGKVLRLTPPTDFTAGSAFYTTALDLSQSFQTRFQFSIHDGSSAPADGISFIVQSDPRGPTAVQPGGPPGYIGYLGIAPSLAVELDIFHNGFEADGNHVAIIKNGDYSNNIDLTDPPFTLFGRPAYAWIDYDAVAKSLQVFVSRNSTRPSTPLLSYATDLAAELGGGPAYVGFTGGTGSFNATQDILSWSFTAGSSSQLNPPGFDPTGKYNLFIFCANSPCSTLAAADSGVARSGSAFGEIGIHAFQPSTGLLGGDATLVAFPPNSNGAPENVPFLNQFFGIEGRIASGTIALDFKPFHPDKLSASSLTGSVTYGGKSASGGGYQPVFGGPIGSSDGWVACFEQAQRDCVQPATSNKGAGKVADACGVGALASLTLSAGLAAPVSAAFTLCGFIFGIIDAFDPPDRHYKHLTEPPHISGSHVSAGHGLSANAAAAATRVATVLAQTAANGTAFLDAYQRFQGAARATDPKWLGPQYLATLKYGHALAAQTRHAAAMIAAARSTLASSPLGSSRISPQTLDRLLRSTRRHGWPSRMVKQLERWGIPASSIQATRKLIPTTAPADAGTPLGPILDPSFVAHLRSYADRLDRYLDAFARRPLR